MKYKLMVKTHLETGLKYLCCTKQSGRVYDRYLGSGKYWKRHLEVHGKKITTNLIFESESKKEFMSYALQKSYELDVVDSDEWANLKHEDGSTGIGFKFSDKTKENWSKNRKGKVHSTRLNSEIINNILNHYKSRPDVPSEYIAKNGKMLSYDRAYSKEYCSLYGISDKGLYNIITGRTIAWKENFDTILRT